MKGCKECTTLCYLEKDGKYLLLYRDSKENDENHGKYIGVGGHIEPGETPEECVVREVREETGLILHSAKLRGLLTFVFEDKDELAFLFTSEDFDGTLTDHCEEGRLEWIEKEKVLNLPIWEGDRAFLERLEQQEEYFSMKLVYDRDRLVAVEEVTKRC